MPVWDRTLKAMLDWNREQKPINQEELEKELCPYCIWRLKINEHGQKACPICERIYD